jgi:hypothetical protein
MSTITKEFKMENETEWVPEELTETDTLGYFFVERLEVCDLLDNIEQVEQENKEQ